MLTAYRLYLPIIALIAGLSFASQVLAYDYTALRVYETSKRFKAQNKPSHAKEHYDTVIFDYYFNFGTVSHAKKKYGRYLAQKDPDFVTGYKNRRVNSFQRKDELGPFPRGEELYVRWKYKKKMYEDHVDLKALLADIDFDDSGRLFEAKTGFQLFVKVKGKVLFVYTSQRSKTRTLIYQSSTR